MYSVLSTCLVTSGFPHSEISGSKSVCRLPEAYRRLLRPSSPLTAKASTICAYSLDHITPRGRLEVTTTNQAFVTIYSITLTHTCVCITPHKHSVYVSTQPMQLLLFLRYPNFKRAIARDNKPHKNTAYLQCFPVFTDMI